MRSLTYNRSFANFITLIINLQQNDFILLGYMFNKSIQNNDAPKCINITTAWQYLHEIHKISAVQLRGVQDSIIGWQIVHQPMRILYTNSIREKGGRGSLTSAQPIHFRANREILVENSHSPALLSSLNLVQKHSCNIRINKLLTLFEMFILSFCIPKRKR